MIWEAYRDQRFSFQRDEERRKVSWPSVETTCIEEPDHDEEEEGERDETSVLVFFSRIHEQEQEHEEEHEKEATEVK